MPDLNISTTIAGVTLAPGGTDLIVPLPKRSNPFGWAVLPSTASGPTGISLDGRQLLYTPRSPGREVATEISVTESEEVFVAKTRAEAIRLAQPYLEEKYKAYRSWGQDEVMPEGDDFNHAFDELLEDRFLLGSPTEVADQLIQLNHRLGMNHLVASIHWPGMPNSLALEQVVIQVDGISVLRGQGDVGKVVSSPAIRSRGMGDKDASQQKQRSNQRDT